MLSLYYQKGFSPRNGEVILKVQPGAYFEAVGCFSPRNGEVILKEEDHNCPGLLVSMFQSPQWGSNSKVNTTKTTIMANGAFQSPQWGSNSKVKSLFFKARLWKVSVPAMGK